MSAASDILDLFCPVCAYNLRGLTTDRCPECGQAFDRAALSHSRIAWMHRHRIGWLRAFFRTVWQATFRPAQLATSMASPLPIRDAFRFWIITALTLYAITAWPLLWLPVDRINYHLPDWGMDFQLPIFATSELPHLVYVYWLALLLTLSLIQCLSITRAASNAILYQRALAVGLYLSGATLLITAVGSLIVYCLVGFWIARGDAFVDHIALLLTFPLCAGTLLSLAPAFIMFRHIAHSSSLRTLLAILRLLLFWCLAALVCCIGLPWVVGLLSIIVYSIK